MSVLIKGMEMPTNCYDCPFIRQSFGCDFYCAKGNGIEDDIKKVYSKRMDDCPLVEIPIPHGRLIDADETIRIWDGATIEWSIKPLIDARPTVIEAEGSET